LALRLAPGKLHDECREIPEESLASDSRPVVADPCEMVDPVEKQRDMPG
jgi:hypothetical protein